MFKLRPSNSSVYTLKGIEKNLSALRLHWLYNRPSFELYLSTILLPYQRRDFRKSLKALLGPYARLCYTCTQEPELEVLKFVNKLIYEETLSLKADWKIL